MKRILLDTHAFLWLSAGHQQASAVARRIFNDDTIIKYLSIASVWELSIKVTLGKLDLAMPFTDFVTQEILDTTLQLLPIDVPHILQLQALPPIHRDPFDRLLIAQAQAEALPLLTHDGDIDKYDVTVVW